MTVSNGLEIHSARKNILLRPPAMEDAELFFEAVQVSIPELSHWMEWCNESYSIDLTIEWIKYQPESWENDTNYQFAVVDDKNGQILGGCGLNHFNRYYQMANLGYWIRSDRTNEGIATEATILLAQFGFEKLGLRRIEIVTGVENFPSRRVAEKAGATFEGILRRRVKHREINIDGEMFSLIPEDL